MLGTQRCCAHTPWAGAMDGVGLKGQPSLNLELEYRAGEQKASCELGHCWWGRVTHEHGIAQDCP